MNPLTFEQAVEIAKLMIVPHLSGNTESDRTTLEGLASWRANQCDTTDDAGYTEYRAENYGASMLLEHPEELIKSAETDYFCFLALSRGVANVMELGWPIPRSLQLWLSGYLRGEVTPPPRPRAQPTKEVRRLKIYCAVQFLVDKGMKPTRNATSKTCESASDAVALANKQLLMAPRSYKRVLEIYSEEKKLGESLQIMLAPELSEVIRNTSGTTG